MTHCCRAINCQAIIPKAFLLCSPHWQMLPIDLQGKVYGTFQSGTVGNIKETKEWALVATEVLNYLGQREGLLSEIQAKKRMNRTIAQFEED